MNSALSIDSAARRILYVVVAAILLAASLPFFSLGRASATQLTTRSITLSDSAVSGTSITSGVGSGTNVTYKVGFTSIAAASSLIIDFCAEDPIVNDTCTTPTAMNASSAALNAAPITGTVSTTTNNWTVSASAGQVKIHNDNVAGSNPTHDIQTASAQVFELSGITNTTTVGTFFARIYTYANNSYGTYTNAAAAGNYVDYGGIALATTSVITITARVEEQISFCVTSADPNTWSGSNDCSDPAIALNPPAVTLGHGSPTPILDASATDTGSIWTQLSTNATHGAVINLRNSNTCGGLSADNGATCGIPSVDTAYTGGGVAHALPLGTAAFGLFVNTYTNTGGIGTTGAGGIGAVGSLTPTAAYYNGSHTTTSTPVWYGMDMTTSGNTVASTYGSTVATTALPVYRAENQYIFAATASLTTPAGIYVANMNLVATGTF